MKASNENKVVALGISDVSIEMASDCSVIFYVDAEKLGVSSANELTRRLTQCLVYESPLWLREYIPSYNSLLIEFDLDRADHIAVRRYCEALIVSAFRHSGSDGSAYKVNQHDADTTAAIPANTHRIPVCYELTSFDSDICKVAQLKEMTQDAIIKLHCSKPYQVYATGFLPGFAYLGELPLELSQPRLDKPRLKVPAGAVAIADQQTAIYPLESPGGWHILGFTPISLLSDEIGIQALLKTGDKVEFYPITQEQYLHWPEACCNKNSLRSSDGFTS